MNAATTGHLLSIPHILAFSPSLAALHAARARKAHPGQPARALFPLHCAKCGTHLLDGSGHVRSSPARTRGKRRRARTGAPSADATGDAQACGTLTRTCGSCGFAEARPVDRSSRAAFPMARKAARAARDAPLKDASLGLLTLGHLEPTVQGVANGSAPRGARSSPQPLLGGKSTPPTTAETAASSKSGPANATPSNNSLKAKTRPKKKTGLQELLAKNREKQQQDARNNGRSDAAGGLAAFLSGL